MKLAFGITLGKLGLAGLVARGVLGGASLEEGANPNQALPMLFIELFLTWLAALIGVGILAATMSTAGGLVVSFAGHRRGHLTGGRWRPCSRRTPSKSPDCNAVNPFP